ncbi:MAG: hypothetical protein LUD72_06560 [Bacteroidales bacterium]|nr:hypothetical protein [Bacteroidales bacterium]
MKKDVNPYYVLKRREIYNVLIGDTTFGEYVYSDYSSDKDLIRLPYLKGSDLCNLSTSYGLSVTYDSHFGSSVRPQNLSRWQYMENLLKFMIEENRCSTLLTDLLSLDTIIEINVHMNMPI